MSDETITKTVSPFWRCPDWCNRGSNYRAELDALRQRVAELERNYAEQVELACRVSAERDRLQATVVKLNTIISGLLPED